MTDNRLIKKQELLNLYVRTLGEHFDSVRVFVTVHDSESNVTFSLDGGTGNFNSQKGQVRDWMEAERARMSRYGWDRAYRGTEGGR